MRARRTLDRVASKDYPLVRESSLFGWDINTHTGRTSLPREKLGRLRDSLAESPSSRDVAPAKDVLSLTGKLWNVTFILRAWKFFMRQLSRLVNLHDHQAREQTVLVHLGRTFHHDNDSWKCAIQGKLVSRGAGLAL